MLTTDVLPEAREGWYERQLRGGVQAVICHPKLVQTGLDLIEFPTILFYETDTPSTYFGKLAGEAGESGSAFR